MSHLWFQSNNSPWLEASQVRRARDSIVLLQVLGVLLSNLLHKDLTSDRSSWVHYDLNLAMRKRSCASAQLCGALLRRSRCWRCTVIRRAGTRRWGSSHCLMKFAKSSATVPILTLEGFSGRLLTPCIKPSYPAKFKGVKYRPILKRNSISARVL